MAPPGGERVPSIFKEHYTSTAADMHAASMLCAERHLAVSGAVY